MYTSQDLVAAEKIPLNAPKAWNGFESRCVQHFMSTSNINEDLQLIKHFADVVQQDLRMGQLMSASIHAQAVLSRAKSVKRQVDKKLIALKLMEYSQTVEPVRNENKDA
jgi:hypothetical protein